MALIYIGDLFPILLTTVLFSALATAHRVLVPNKYSAFLQFKQEEDTKKTAQSTAIRIVYLIVGIIFLNCILKFTGIQIAIGIFLSCFLNIWPAIIQHQLLRLRKSGVKWLLLIGYVCFVVFSVLVGGITIGLLIPILRGERQLFWLDNQALSIVITLLTVAIPIPLETVIAKFSCMVIVQDIDTFLEEVYILEKQLNMKCPEIQNNKYVIDNVAKECDINVILLKTILQLEIFYRGRAYYRIIERVLCKCFKRSAIKRDISIGIAQMKISTVQKVMRKNPYDFIRDITNDEMNIKVCGKYLRQLIDEYQYKLEKEYYSIEGKYSDVFDYIACQYSGGIPETKERTILIYSAILRSMCSNSPLVYAGSREREEYSILLYSPYDETLSYQNFQNLVEEIENLGIIRKQVLVGQKEMKIELFCRDSYNLSIVQNVANRYNLQMKIE